MKIRQRIIMIVLLVLLVVSIVLGTMCTTLSLFKNKTDIQITQRIKNNISSAIDQVNRLESSVNSSTSQRLGVVRQYVHTVEELNAMSIALYGEQGRHAPSEAFTTLYQDLSQYDQVVQSAKNSTMDIRELLLNHLTSLQAFINGEITSK